MNFEINGNYYCSQHSWNIFIDSIRHEPEQNQIGGTEPSRWANSYLVKHADRINIHENLLEIPPNLPNTRLNRLQLRQICQNPKNDVLYGYICVMAWGGQGQLNPICAWQHRATIKQILLKIRSNNGEFDYRDINYSLFREEKIPCLGPAFWTKLLFFFSYTSDCYIMDQWTSKAINLILGVRLIDLDGDAVNRNNTSNQYKIYCEAIDNIALKLNMPGERIEEFLISKGGANPRPWRNHLRGYHSFNLAAFPAE